MSNHWKVPEKIAFLLTIIIIAFVALILSMMLLRLVNKFYIQKQTIIKSIQLSSTISLTAAILSVLFDLVHVEGAYTLHEPLHKDTFYEIRALSDFFMFLSLLSFFINIYFRLIKSVEGTAFAISKSFKLISIILLIILTIFELFYVVMLVFKMSHYSELNGYIYGLFTYFHVFFFLIIVSKFVYKLREVHKVCIELAHEPATKIMTCNSKIELIKETTVEDNNFLIIVITKHSVLSTICLIPFVIRFTFRKILGFYDENTLSEYVWMTSYLGRDIVLLSTSLFIYLGIKFNVKQYQTFCKICDKCFYSMCIFFMTTQDTKSEIGVKKPIELETVANSNETNDKKSELTVMSIQTQTISTEISNKHLSGGCEKNVYSVNQNKSFDDILIDMCVDKAKNKLELHNINSHSEPIAIHLMKH